MHFPLLEVLCQVSPACLVPALHYPRVLIDFYRTKVYREFVETAAVMARLAPSHIRFGTFEFYAHQRRADLVQRLADYTIKHHFAHITAQDETKYLLFFKEVINTTAMLMAKWQV